MYVIQRGINNGETDLKEERSLVLNSPYPCFRSFDPDSGFCTMKCEFAEECEPQTPASAKGQEDNLEDPKGGSTMADNVKKLVEELEATPIDDLLEKLAVYR